MGAKKKDNLREAIIISPEYVESVDDADWIIVRLDFGNTETLEWTHERIRIRFYDLYVMDAIQEAIRKARIVMENPKDEDQNFPE